MLYYRSPYQNRFEALSGSEILNILNQLPDEYELLTDNGIGVENIRISGDGSITLQRSSNVVDESECTAGILAEIVTSYLKWPVVISDIGNVRFIEVCPSARSVKLFQSKDNLPDPLPESVNLAEPEDTDKEAASEPIADLHAIADRLQLTDQKASSDLRRAVNHLVSMSVQELVDSVKLMNAGPNKDGGFGVDLQGGACRLLIEAFVDQFKGSGATNFLEVGFNSEDLGHLIVTIQRTSGKTPAQLKKEAEEEVERLREEVEALSEIAQNARDLTSLVENKGQPSAHPDNQALQQAGDTIQVNEGKLIALQIALDQASSRNLLRRPAGLGVRTFSRTRAGGHNDLLDADDILTALKDVPGDLPVGISENEGDLHPLFALEWKGDSLFIKEMDAACRNIAQSRVTVKMLREEVGRQPHRTMILRDGPVCGIDVGRHGVGIWSMHVV